MSGELRPSPWIKPLVGAACLLLFACGLALLAGSRWLSPLDLWNALTHTDQTGPRSAELLLLSTFRAPRVAGAVLIGALLALSGCLLQSVTRNVLADSGMLGLHSGAHLLLVILLLALEPVTAGRLRVPVAFAGATAAAALVFFTARRGRTSSARGDGMLIVGIAIGAMLHAAGLLLAFAAPSEILARAMAWSTGHVGGLGSRDISLLATVLFGVGAIALLIGPRLDVLALGDERAQALGVSVARLRLLATGLAVFAAAVCVAVGGAVPELGLLAPNLARRITRARAGLRTRPLLVLAACCGSLLLIFADLLGRTAFGFFELPAGILIAAVGTPYFLWLLVTR